MENNFTYNILRFIRHLVALLVPGGLVVLCSYLALHYSILTPWLERIEQLVPYVILGIGLLLGWRFHRSRLVFVLLILFISERSLFYFGAGKG